MRTLSGRRYPLDRFCNSSTELTVDAAECQLCLVALCLLCDPDAADAEFRRERVWENDLWRLSIVPHGPIAGFAHLEPKRHIPFIVDLDGAEAATLGSVLARVTRALRDAAGAEKTYVYVFGDHMPHLHFNLAPHREGDALRGGPGLLEADAAMVDELTHEAVTEAIRQILASD